MVWNVELRLGACFLLLCSSFFKCFCITLLNRWLTTLTVEIFEATDCFKKIGPHRFFYKIKTSLAISFKLAESATDIWHKLFCEKHPHHSLNIDRLMTLWVYCMYFGLCNLHFFYVTLFICMAKYFECSLV